MYDEMFFQLAVRGTMDVIEAAQPLLPAADQRDRRHCFHDVSFRVGGSVQGDRQRRLPSRDRSAVFSRLMAPARLPLSMPQGSIFGHKSHIFNINHVVLSRLAEMSWRVLVRKSWLEQTERHVLGSDSGCERRFEHQMVALV